MTGPTEPTASSVGKPLDAKLEAMARDAAPGLLAEAFEQARAEVRSILRDRLVRALLDAGNEAGTEVPAAGVAGGVGSAVDQGRARSIETEKTRSIDRAQGRGVYLYGFTSAATRVGGELQGIDHADVYTLVEDDLAAVVSDVALDGRPWGIGPDGEPDLALLAPHFEEHEQVLEAVLAQGTVLPARLGTTYRSAEDVRQLLRGQPRSIHQVLERLEGKVEWGLTVTWDSQLAAGNDHDDAESAPSTMPQPTTAPGRAYLGKREADKARAERLEERRHTLSVALHQAVAATATASVVHPLGHRGRAASDTLLRSSYLVDAGERPRFEAAIVAGLESGADLGLKGDLTGPWPPYNFATLELDGATA